MAKYVKTKNGKTIVLRNPAEKGARYAKQLKAGKVEETGKTLTPTDRSYRVGYLRARSDNANAYKSKHPRKYPKKKLTSSNSRITYSRDELYTGTSKRGTKVYDGVYACVGTNEYQRVENQSAGTNIIRKNGKAYKVQGKGDISTSIDWFFK